MIITADMSINQSYTTNVYLSIYSPNMELFYLNKNNESKMRNNMNPCEL